ncbi:MAG TPA: restriction endonuclease subunit S [Roseiflexaceae bacterium]|nr:restriction endonuclease subunit S [Roseiflexaceae bacterium]
MENKSILLKDLLLFTKDGEWGHGSADDGLVEMSVIRGTDFESVRLGDLSNIPIRYIPINIADRKRLKAGDILIETAGGTKDQPTGRTVYLKSNLFDRQKRSFICASFSRFLRINDEIADPEYVYWYLKYLYVTGEMYPYHIQHTGVARFQYTEFASKTFIPLPSSREQRAIARILGSLDDKIELNRRANATLEELARGLFRSWFVDFAPVRAKAEGRAPAGMDAATAALFPDGFETVDGREVPRGWRFGSVYEIADVVYGAPFASQLFNTERNGLPLIRIRDLVDHNPEVFTPEEHPKQIIIQPGDIVVGMDGEFRVHHWNGPISKLNQRLCTFKPRDGFPKMFVSEVIKKPMMFFEQSKTGTTVIHLGKSDIDTIQVVIPYPSVLERFAELTNPIMNRMLLNAEQSRTLAALRDALLPKLLSGELRVREAERLGV